MKRRIIGIALIVVLLAGIVYFGCRLASAGKEGNNDIPAVDDTNIDLTEIDKVIIPDGMPSKEKKYEGFTVGFNPANKTPNYVSWILLGEETEGASARSNKFWTDKEVEGCPDTRDYSRSGYDRGHMCPAGEQKWSDEAMHNSFVMTNICPQIHELNTGAWKTLEDKERIWAKRDSVIVIVAGPIYSNDDTKTIGTNEVRVPGAFFKVLLAPYADPVRAIGFVYPNMKSPGNMADYATTVDEVEKITGFDFFSSLPDDIEEAAESATSFREWNFNRKNDRKGSGK